VAGAGADQIGLVFLGTLLFGGGTAANLQARYTAVDLADPADRAGNLSVRRVGHHHRRGRPARSWPRWPTGPCGAAGIREYAGPFVFSAMAFGLAAILIAVLLRPDPLQLARDLELRAAPPEPPPPAEPSADAPPPSCVPSL
jgi:hypothetical protein